MSKNTRCKVQHFAIGDKGPTTLLEDRSLAEARKYMRDWVHFRKDGPSPYKKDPNADRYQNKFSAIYIEEYIPQ